jgi:hypothetical protein
MPAIPRAEGDERVTNLELFFDLVFVFAITQVTGLMAHEPTWTGLGQGMLVLSALWFAWASFAWLTNTLDPEEAASGWPSSPPWPRCWSRRWRSRGRSPTTASRSASPTCSCA